MLVMMAPSIYVARNYVDGVVRQWNRHGWVPMCRFLPALSYSSRQNIRSSPMAHYPVSLPIVVEWAVAPHFLSVWLET